MAKGDYTIKIEKKRLEQLIAQSPAVASEVVRRFAFEGERYVKQSFGTSPAGRVYGRHVASRAGYPPNVDTGKLRNSINVRKLAAYSYSINTGDVEYAPYLEFGSKRMAARPYMLPMVVWLRNRMSKPEEWKGLAR